MTQTWTIRGHHLFGHSDWFRYRLGIQARTISAKGINYGTFTEKSSFHGVIHKKVCLELLVATLTHEGEMA